MTRAQRVMLMVGVVPLVAFVVGGGAVVVASIPGKLPYDYSNEFVATAQGVRVESDVSTQLVASVDGKVHVTVDGSYAVAKPEITVAPKDGTLTVVARCPDAHCRVDLTVEVPAEAAVQATVDGTSLDVSGVSSPLTLATTGGSVNLARVRSTDVSVDVRGGSADLFFDSPPTQLRATTRDGSITVQLPRSVSYQIDAVASQGSTYVDIPNDPSADRRLYLRTSYGSITIH
jgi:hypothetical protein